MLCWAAFGQAVIPSPLPFQRWCGATPHFQAAFRKGNRSKHERQMTSDEILTKVLSFIEHETSERIDPGVDIFSTLGIDGIEGDLFYEAFASEFGIDMRDFHYAYYYTSDADLLNWPKALWLRMRGKVPRHYEVNADHLAEVVRRGRWFVPG